MNVRDFIGVTTSQQEHWRVVQRYLRGLPTDAETLEARRSLVDLLEDVLVLRRELLRRLSDDVRRARDST